MTWLKRFQSQREQLLASGRAKPFNREQAQDNYVIYAGDLRLIVKIDGANLQIIDLIDQNLIDLYFGV